MKILTLQMKSNQINLPAALLIVVSFFQLNHVNLSYLYTPHKWMNVLSIHFQRTKNHRHTHIESNPYHFFIIDVSNIKAVIIILLMAFFSFKNYHYFLGEKMNNFRFLQIEEKKSDFFLSKLMENSLILYG